MHQPMRSCIHANKKEVQRCYRSCPGEVLGKADRTIVAMARLASIRDVAERLV